MGRAARFYGAGQRLRIEDVGYSKPGPDEVLIRVEAAGICRSDIRTVDGIGYLVKPPLTLGHEIAGEIVELGSNVDRYREGDRVVVHWGGSCNRCRYCLEGRAAQCPYAADKPMYGLTADGGFAEYCKVDAANLVMLPEGITWEFGATLGCAGVTAYHAVNTVAHVGLGDWVGVYGAGGVGIFAIQVAKMYGANVIAIGRNAQKLEMARRLGADYVVDATNEKSAMAQVKALTGELGVDVVIDTVSGQQTVVNAFGTLREKGCLANGGKVVLVAMPSSLSFEGSLFVRNEIWVGGSRYGTIGELKKVVDLAATKRLRSVSTRKFSLEEVNEGIEELRQGAVVGRAFVSMGRKST